MTIYRLRYYTGMELRDEATTDYLTEEQARTDALKDTWNEGYVLYKVEAKADEDGRINYKETRVGEIKGGRNR